MTHRDIVMRKLFSYAPNADFDGIDLDETGWWNTHEWTQAEQTEFSDWLHEYLKCNRDARKEMMVVPVKADSVIRRAVTAFLSRYGWRVKQTSRREAERR